MPGARIVIVVGIAALLVLPLVWHFSEQVVAQDECPSPRLIDEVTGSGDQESPPFNSTTDLLRISYDVQAERDTVPFFIDVRDADDADAPSVGDATTQGTDSDQTFVNAPPGRYFLEIGTTSAQYTIQIEECGEGGEANPSEGKSGEGTVSSKTPTAPKTPATPPKSSTSAPKSPPKSQPKSEPKDTGTLMKAGAPKSGPVPRMPSGECPDEYPKEDGGACFR